MVSTLDGSPEDVVHPRTNAHLILELTEALMKRTALAGTFALLAGAFTLILAASIFYSCRSGGDPHNTRSSAAVSQPPAHETLDEIGGPSFSEKNASPVNLGLVSSSSRKL